MTLEEEIIAGLEEFRDKLVRGERIVCTTILRCGCEGEDKRCPDCNGRGYCIGAKTFLPPEASPDAEQ